MNNHDETIPEDIDFTDNHLTVMEWLFSDLTSLTTTDIQLFLDLYYNRVSDITVFCTHLENSKDTKGNYTVVARSGIGKTSFLYRFVDDQQLCKNLGISIIIVDYRAAIPQTWEGCLLSFVEQSEKCFKIIGYEIHTLLKNTKENLRDNAKAILEHIEYIEGQKNGPHIVIFLDDFDYADDVWFKLLDYFMPFANQSSASVVLTVRPPLYACIKGYDNRQAFHFTKNIKEIKLESLKVREILASRLAPILVRKKSRNFIDFLIDMFKIPSLEERIIKKLGIKKIEELPEFEYPLTEKHNNFMQLITNGDLREVFKIAYDSIRFVMKNRSKLDYREEYGHKRYIIGHENTLKLFCDNKQASYIIINLHQRRSRSGNSLWYNTLEAVKTFGIVDDVHFYPALKTLGHSKDVVNRAINDLLDKPNRFIEPIKIINPRIIKAKGYGNDEYRITDKGDYYLYLVTWPEYKERYGEPGRSLIKEYKS